MYRRLMVLAAQLQQPALLMRPAQLIGALVRVTPSVRPGLQTAPPLSQTAKADQCLGLA